MRMTEPQYATSPPHRDERPELPTETQSAAAPAAFPLSIVYLPLGGAFVVCGVMLMIGAIVASALWQPTGTDGDGLADVVRILLTFVMVGPAAFAALFVWMMRRHGRDKPTVLGTVTAAGLLPALVIGSLAIVHFTRNRGLSTTGLVAMLVFIVLALTWVLVAMKRQPFRTGMLGAAVGVIVLVFTVLAANLNADAHDRALQRQAISGENAPLALFDPRGALNERDGWRIARVDTIHVDRSHHSGSLGLALESDVGQRLRVDFRSIEEGGRCAPRIECEPLFTLGDGTVVLGQRTPTGTHFDIPTPHNQGWWALSTSSSMSTDDLHKAIGLLQPVTVDAWIAAQDRFAN